MKNLNKHRTKEFGRPIDKHNWKRGDHGLVAVYFAGYEDSDNTIYIPAGILDGMFFQDDRPKYMNYGAIGRVIGRTITQGFDDIGSQYNSEGNLANWWSKETKEKFNKNIECIIDQYSNFKVQLNGEILKLNGSINHGNIADNGGIKLAIRAYDRMTMESREEPRLPGLHYTPRQLFWLSSAMHYCRALKPESEKDHVIRAQSAPRMFRVNVPLMNREEFSRDWKCPTGAFMNPIKKCEVW